MLPDWKFPETPEGFELIGVEHPRAGHYVASWGGGKPRLIKKEDEQYFVEHHPVFRKIKKSKKKK